MSSLRVGLEHISGVTVFAPDFKPERGGVAEYTYQLGLGLSNIGGLNRVITTVPQNQEDDYAFDVLSIREERPDSSPKSIVQKVKERFLSYRAFVSLLANKSSTHVLVTWTQGIEAEIFLSRCMKYDISFSLVFHGYDLLLLSKQKPSFLKEICTHADVLIFNSEATCQLYTDLTCSSPSQSYILYPGINPAELESAAKTPTRVLEDRYDIELEGKTVILSVARLVKRKGIDIALRAIAPIVEAHDSCRYVIAGTGPEYDVLRSEVDALGLRDKIQLTGEVSDAEKYGLLETSSVFVMPNHTRGGDDFEGFGISFIEASYFRNVVVGGRSGGAVEAISEEKSGFLIDFEQNNAEERLQERVDDLTSDRNRIDDLAQQGRTYVLENFQFPKLVADFARSLNGLGVD
jgi:glycosyltransferase involved in cell wall biosynthesis